MAAAPSRRRRAVAVAATALLVLAAAPGPTPSVAAHGEPPTELLGDGGPAEPMRDQAVVDVSAHGYRFIAGQQHSRLTVTATTTEVTYVDTATSSWKRLPDTCVALEVAQGVAATCTIPETWANDDGTRSSSEMFLEIWPRLGNDHVDATAVPAEYRVWVLADAGNDRVRLGVGDGFVNGAQGDDLIHGGAGDDWLRGGRGQDRVDGGDGDDKLVGQLGADLLDGGAGDDHLYGTEHADRLVGGPGADTLSCGSGPDVAVTDDLDRVRGDCETVERR